MTSDIAPAMMTRMATIGCDRMCVSFDFFVSKELDMFFEKK